MSADNLCAKIDHLLKGDGVVDMAPETQALLRAARDRAQGHKCEPEEKSTPFWWDCKVCGRMIEPVPCPPCDGTGGQGACRFCNGSGVIEWRKVT